MPFVVHIDAGREWGGGQQQCLALAQDLAAQGHRVHVIAQRDGPLARRLSASSLSWEALRLRGAHAATAALVLWRRFRALRPEVVHVHEAAAEGPAIWAAVRARGAGARPRVVTTRRTEFRRRRRRPMADRVVCVSEAVRARMEEGGVPAERLIVIPDFVDCAHYQPAAVAAAPLDFGPTIVSVGRLTPEKGHRLLVEAMPAVLRKVPEARLVLCGQGPEEAALRARAGALGVAARITLVGFAEDVRPLVAAADVVAMPSLSEGLGVAALEAMAMGRPVVASDAGGLPEAVADGGTGVVVPKGRVEPLAAALVALLSDPARARQMGEAGRRRALERFDRPVVVGRIATLYEQLLAEAG